MERILENWDALLEYFQQAVQTDKLKSAEIILNELQNTCTKTYLHFMKYVLSYFNKINALFQSKKPLVHELHSESVKIFMKLGQNFIRHELLCVTVDVRSPHTSLSVEDIFLGTECNDLLKQMPKTQGDRIRNDCLQFYIVALEEIQKQLPINDNSIFKEMSFLDPRMALDLVPNRNKVCLINFASSLK